MRKASILPLALAAALTFAPTDAFCQRFRRLVVVGDSILAGFGSGGLVGRGKTGQVNGAASLVAKQAGHRLKVPAMSAPGVPPPLSIRDANHNGVLEPGDVTRRVDGIGFRSKPLRPARNLAVPGEDIGSIFDEIGADDVGKQLAGAEPNGRDILKFLIVGLPPDTESASQLTRAANLDPTFLMVWIGNNDVLGMATGTDPTNVDRSRAAFAERFRAMLDRLADTGASMAVANLPDVTGIASLRHAAGEVTQCRAGGGTLLPVAPDDLLSIDLPRSTLPTPGCGKVLDAAERAAIRATVIGFNEEISAAIADVEVARGVGIAEVDMFALFDDLRTNGADVDGDGLPDVTTGYLGGVFSLDGVHPTRTGHALIANAFIEAIDQRFGEALAPVDVARIRAHDSLATNRFRPVGEPPFGLIDDDETDAIDGFFERIFDEVARGAEDIGRSFLDRLERWFGDLF